MGNEAVISRIAHRGVEKPVDLKRAALLVHLILDRLAADRHFDDDVDIVGRILADRYSVQVHACPPNWGCVNSVSQEEDHSAEAERDSIALLTAEGLARAAQDPPAQPAVKPDRPVVVRKRPD